MPSETETQTIEFGPFRISTVDRLLHRDGQVVHLFPKSVDILLLLLSSNKRVLTRDELIQVVWGGTNIQDGGLTRSISDLRKALGDVAKKPLYIQTIHTNGYRWIGPVSARVKATTAPPQPKSRAIAVYPLENLSRDPGENYFASGMTGALLTSLGKIANLKVIAYPGAKPGSAQSSEADFALTGSVLHEGSRVRITVHLLEVGTGRQVWAESYDADVESVIALQATISRRIADEIRVQLTPQDEGRLAASRKVTPAAYIEYLQGRYHWNRRTSDDFRKAIRHFRRAIEIDPAWAAPHAGMADVYLLLGSTSYDALPPLEAMPEAKTAAALALEMDDSNAEAHASMGYALLAFDWDFPAAAKEFLRALELNPGYPTAHHWYAHYLLAMGKFEDSIGSMRKAWEREPNSLAINSGLGWSLYLARHYDEAIAQYLKTLELDGNFVVARCMLGMAYERKGMKSEAVAEFRRALVIAPENAFALARLGQTYGVSGNREEALRILDQLAGLAKTRYIPSTYAGAVFEALGDYDQAFACARKSYEERSHYLIYLNVEPSLDGFRADRRFPDLARRIGLIQ